jgi:hypothetical protein
MKATPMTTAERKARPRLGAQCHCEEKDHDGKKNGGAKCINYSFQSG